MTKIRFTIPGEPCAKGRPRFTREGRAYTPGKTVAYENLIKLAYAQQVIGDVIIGGSLIMVVWAYFGIPKSASKRMAEAMRKGDVRPTKRPDADNVGKTVADALNGIAYKDDSQITDMFVHKRYADNPRVVVEIEEVEG